MGLLTIICVAGPILTVLGAGILQYSQTEEMSPRKILQIVSVGVIPVIGFAIGIAIVLYSASVVFYLDREIQKP